jgi:hypothetical protein
MTARPIEHCYWVVPGKFLAGEYPRNLDPHSSAKKIQALLASGVTAFIDLTREDDRLLPYSSMLKGVVYHNFPVVDVSIPDSPEVTVAILDAIDEHLREGRVIYLHCWGGIGRTGTIVGCWLVRHGWQGRAMVYVCTDLCFHGSRIEAGSPPYASPLDPGVLEPTPVIRGAPVTAAFHLRDSNLAGCTEAPQNTLRSRLHVSAHRECSSASSYHLARTNLAR